MMLEISNIAVKRLPEALSTEHARILLNEFESCIDAGHPRIVIDCTQLRQDDNAMIHFLLRCLEEAMKRNGDVKLAALPKGAVTKFGVTGIDRLFEVFDSVDDAVESFSRIPTMAVQFGDASEPASSL